MARSVVFAWILLASILGGLGALIGMRTVLPGPSSPEVIALEAGEVRASGVGMARRDAVTFTLGSQEAELTDARFIAAREDLVEVLKDAPDGNGDLILEGVETQGHTWLDEELFVSHDRHHLLIVAHSRAPVSSASASLSHLNGVVERWRERYPGFSLEVFSNGLLGHEMFELINRDLDRSLIYTIPLTLIVLLWSFRSVVAALVPLFVAIVSLIASLGTAAILSHIVGPISAAAAQLVVLLVLATGVDYSLFTVSRVREEVHGGVDYRTAILRARLSSGRAVIWSGLTVAISLSGLFLMQDTVLTSMALVSLVAVLLTVLGCGWGLPALLTVLGSKLEWGRLFSEGCEGVPRGMGWVRLSTKFPRATGGVGVIVLAFIASYGFQLQIGSSVDPSILPQHMNVVRAFRVLETSFPRMVGADFGVILAGPKLAELEDEAKLQPLFDAIGQYPGIVGPVHVDRSKDGTVARFEFLANGGNNVPSNWRLVDEMRTKLFPQVVHSNGLEGYLVGTLPFAVDEVTRYRTRTPYVLMAVLALSFCVLLVAFRSIVIPIKAIVLNGISCGAAYGILVLCFGSGVGVAEIGTSHRYVIEGFVPALLFAILFGLSMDYHVFLLSRVREEHSAAVPMSEAVARAIGATSRTITGAALIMVSVFAVIATLELPFMRQLGVGLAAAIIIDATIVRSMLLPAGMVLLGEWNWYLPKWLRWIPVVRIH